MNITLTLTPAATAFMRIATDLDELFETGGDTTDLLAAYRTARAALVAEGRTEDEIGALVDFATN